MRDFGDEFDSDVDMHDRDVMDTFLDELVTMIKATFTYNVDDRWQHKVTLEQISNSDEAFLAF